MNYKELKKTDSLWMLDIFLAFYLLALPFTALWQLPYLGQKLQLTELVFLLALTGIVFTRKQSWRVTKSDGVLLAMPLAYGVAALFHPGKAATLEVIGLVYLYGVYFLVKNSIRQTNIDLIKQAVTYMSILLIIISFVSFFFPMLGVLKYADLAEQKWLPFIGWLPRISGFTATPNMWASTLFFAVFLQIGIWKTGKQDKYKLFIMLGLIVAALLTFSKSLMVAIGVGVLVFGNRKWMKVLGGITIGLYLIFCHWLIVPIGDNNVSVTYFSPENCHLVGNGSFKVCSTTYLRLKEVALAAFIDTKGKGVGGGQFAKFIDSQKKEGEYPIDLPSYDPHSSYFGLLAEAGIIGLLALIVLFAVFRKGILWEKSKQGWYIGGLAYLCLMGIEAWVMDVLNFRMLWVALGMVLAVSDNSQNDEIDLSVK